MTTIQTGDHLSPAEYQCAAARQNRHKLEDRFAAMLAEAGLDDATITLDCLPAHRLCGAADG